MEQEFDLQMFLAQVRRRPGLYLGRKSLIGLRDHLFGMSLAFESCGRREVMKHFEGFIEWYHRRFWKDGFTNGYDCWWNHLLYTSGNCDDQAFDSFFREFERYLMENHQISLPTVD